MSKISGGPVGLYVRFELTKPAAEGRLRVKPGRRVPIVRRSALEQLADVLPPVFSNTGGSHTPAKRARACNRN